MLHCTGSHEGSQLGSTSALHALHDALLPKTIANALQTPFFRERWSNCSTSNIDRTGLARLPLIDKEDIRAAGAAAQNRTDVICNDVFTTGTTGNPLITARSDREQKFITNFYTQLLHGRPAAPLLRGLEFKNPYHGHLVRVPGPIHYHRASVYDAGSFEYGRATLLRHHDDANVEERCSILVGIERCLRAFTLDTLRSFPDGFPSTGLRLVVSYSQYLTAAWRQTLREVWSAPVVDRFGVSEVFGGATQCLQCGWYHFEPCVIPEVIGAHSGEVISSGHGLLALTALFPFQQAQPLVRYLTGDLVEVTHTLSCRPGTTTIKPAGRARYGVPDPKSDRWFVTPASILEAVDAVPEVARTPRFTEVGQICDPYAVGNPKFRTTWSEEQSGLKVKVEVALYRDVSDARRTGILTGIESAIVKSNSLLRDALREGSVTLQIAICEDIEEGDLISQAHSGGVWSAA